MEYFGKYIEDFAKYSISSDSSAAPSRKYAETTGREADESSNGGERFVDGVANFLQNAEKFD